MNPRNLLVVLAAAGIVFAAGLALWQGETLAAPPPDLLPSEADVGTIAPVHDRDVDAQASDGVFHPSSGPVAASGSARRTDTGSWTRGIIRGDIQLAVSTLDRLGAITVVVEELRSPHDGDARAPFRVMVPVERGLGTPTFEVRDIPFSRYPYRVYARAAGLNGGRRTLTIDEEHKLHDDVTLTITPGAPFSVLLRDQDGAPHQDVDIVLRPVGEPVGRPLQRGTTDNFGSVVFEDVLAGDYELAPSKGGHALAEPERVFVQEGARNYGRKVQGQGHVVTIPRGVQVDVQIHDGVGYGIEDCKVTAIATDRRRLAEYTGQTDKLGRLRFPYLQPGRWQITVERQGYQRCDEWLTLTQDQEPVVRQLRLSRAR